MNPSRTLKYNMGQTSKFSKHELMQPGALGKGLGPCEYDRTTKVCSWMDIEDHNLENIWAVVREKFDYDNMNDQRDNNLKHMIKLWNNCRGSLHKNMKFNSLHQILKDVPPGVDKSDWEWLVKKQFLSDKFKAEIQELVQSETCLTNIKVVERCFGPQHRSYAVGFGGGITTKELKGGRTFKAVLLEEQKTTRKEKESLQKRIYIPESKYDRLEGILVCQRPSPPPD